LAFIVVDTRCAITFIALITRAEKAPVDILAFRMIAAVVPIDLRVALKVKG
jgi:hypothetical protein